MVVLVRRPLLLLQATLKTNHAVLQGGRFGAVVMRGIQTAETSLSDPILWDLYL
jgi:hypothetical protein